MANSGDITTVTLSPHVGFRLAPNSLLGCEVRVAKRDPSSPDDVFATGWVISQFGTTLKIRDPDHRVADAWNDSASGTGAAEARGCAAIYDLRQGFLTGRIEGATDTTCTVPGPWFGEDCTYIDVAAAPFDAWMFTPSPSYLWPVEVVLGDGALRTTAKVIDVANPVANVGYQTLIVAGHHETTQGAPGKWYWIGGIGAERDACQTGEWDAAADQDSSGNFTEFTLPSEAYVSDFQVGWLLQPDINVPVYLPITSANNGTITVSGSYGSLVPSSSGTHFRIHAPPGVERTGPFFSGFEAGTLSRFTSASSSRNLFGGYRYESPLAGVRDDLWMAVQGRQSGKNFTGLHYTLHRHYDPHLMRFTSIDPAAAPFFNLYAYCGGNPASGHDPDGLFFMSEYVGMWRKIITGKNRDGTKATWADIGESAWAGNPVTGLLPEAVNPFGVYNDIVKSDSVGEWAWKRAKKAPGLGMVLSQGEQFVNTVADSWKVGEEQGVGSGVGNFLLQRTMSNPTPLVGSTARTIYSGYRATQTGDWWDFAEDLASMGDDAFVLASIVLPAKTGGRATTQAPKAQSPTPITRTNAQLVQEIANRSEAWGTRKGLSPTGHKSGTLKHGHAERMLNRYQSMFGNRGLSAEVRYVNGRPWRKGMPLKGSVRLDVVEGPVKTPIAVYDYKFGGAKLKPGRVNRIRRVAGFGPNVPIHEVRPR